MSLTPAAIVLLSKSPRIDSVLLIPQTFVTDTPAEI